MVYNSKILIDFNVSKILQHEPVPSSFAVSNLFASTIMQVLCKSFTLSHGFDVCLMNCDQQCCRVKQPQRYFLSYGGYPRSPSLYCCPQKVGIFDDFWMVGGTNKLLYTAAT